MNLDYDEELLQLSERGLQGECLRFWESAACFIVLGRTCSVEEDVKILASERDRIPVLRRCSGGGTVLQGEGCLNYTLILSKKDRHELNNINNSYIYIIKKIIEEFSKLKINAEFRKTSDIVLAATNKKFSGNAQRRGRHFILHHGTFLYRFDLSLITKYLKMPPRVPEYRLGRQHEDFVTNLSLEPDRIKDALVAAFSSNGMA
jgi:lipoate-protein ligase A